MKLFKYILALLTLGTTLVFAQEKKLSGKEFLARVRAPFRESSWAKIEGTITYSPKGKRKKRMKMKLGLNFSPKEIDMSLNIAEKDRYTVKQLLKQDKAPDTKLSFPKSYNSTKLIDMGINPEDLTFSFLYWDIKYDYGLGSGDHKVNGQVCRTMELENPKTKETVLVYFSKKYYFPLKMVWYKPGEKRGWRYLEFDGFKKYRKDMWFFEKMLLKGNKWETQVKFDKKRLQIYLNKEKPAPKDLHN